MCPIFVIKISGVSDLQGVKIPDFPLTLLVIVTTVLRYRAACDERKLKTAGGTNMVTRQKRDRHKRDRHKRDRQNLKRQNRDKLTALVDNVESGVKYPQILHVWFTLF